MCSGDGLGRKRKSKKPRGHPERNEDEGSAEQSESGSEGQAPEETAVADGAERLTSAIVVPRRAADQPKGSPGGKAATPERSRINDPQGRLKTGAARRSGGWWQHQPPFSFWAYFFASGLSAISENRGIHVGSGVSNFQPACRT